MKNKLLSLLLVALSLFFPILGCANQNGQANHGHQQNPVYPYPFIDVTNGIPSWVENNSNTTVSVPQNKGSYEVTFDRSKVDGKIYHQKYDQASSRLIIEDVKSKKTIKPQKQ